MTCGAEVGKADTDAQVITSLGNYITLAQLTVTARLSSVFLQWLQLHMCVLSHDHLARTRSVGL